MDEFLVLVCAFGIGLVLYGWEKDKIWVIAGIVILVTLYVLTPFRYG